MSNPSKAAREYLAGIGARGGKVSSAAKKKAALLREKKKRLQRAICNECNKRVTKHHVCNPWLTK